MDGRNSGIDAVSPLLKRATTAVSERGSRVLPCGCILCRAPPRWHHITGTLFSPARPSRRWNLYPISNQLGLGSCAYGSEDGGVRQCTHPWREDQMMRLPTSQVPPLAHTYMYYLSGSTSKWICTCDLCAFFDFLSRTTTCRR